MLNTLEKDSSVLKFIKTLRLLCVENNATTQMIYKLLFEANVKEIIFANSSEEGYRAFAENKVDIVITGNDKPFVDGLKVIEVIRGVDQEIPIILVSAIEDVSVVTKALHLNVNNFIHSPIRDNEVLKALINVSKVLIANRYILEQRNKKIKALEEKERYTQYQEDLAFAKELNILRNDFYYQMKSTKDTILIDFLYQPLDVMSGDAYCAREIKENLTFYSIADGMGKGLSASLSSMLIISFINYAIDEMLKTDSFDMQKLIQKAMDYIKPILLDEEILAIDFILYDNAKDILSYAKFAMPSMLLEDSSNKVIRIKSNNPPLSKYQSDFIISTYDISDIYKFLFYSDGLVENSTKYEDNLYSYYLEDDFKHSFTRENLKDSLFKKIKKQEDDITLIFLNKLNKQNSKTVVKEFKTSLYEMEEASAWYEDIWSQICDDNKTIYKAGVVFTELFMNAYEHGNLDINAQQKHELLDEDIYFETLQEKEKECDKKITVKVSTIKHNDFSYLITQINDEGKGFDTQTLSQIFRNSKSFNGRGVFVSRESSLGIYYNRKGNEVLFLHKF